MLVAVLFLLDGCVNSVVYGELMLLICVGFDFDSF